MDTGHITALVTGANRGLGKHFAAQLVGRGAKVYAAARRPETIELSGVEPLQLDITDPTSVRRAADLAGDVNVLINNAGTSTRAGLLSGAFEDVRLEMETHYFGTLSVIRAFVPVIEGNGGRSNPQHAVGVVLAACSRLRCLLRGEGSRVGDDRRTQTGTGSPWHSGHRRARRVHGHRDGRLRTGRPKDRSRGCCRAGIGRPAGR